MPVSKTGAGGCVNKEMATWDFGWWLSVGGGFCTKLQGKLQLLLSLTTAWEEITKLWLCRHYTNKHKIKGYCGVLCSEGILTKHRNDYWTKSIVLKFEYVWKKTLIRKVLDRQTFGDGFVWWLLLSLVLVKGHGNCSNGHLGDRRK